MIRPFRLAIFLSVFALGEGFSQTAPTSTYTGKPVFQIITKRNNAILGTTNVELFPNIAPHHVRNFDSLVSVGFYDTTAFHRVIPGFMIQGGDPNSRHGPQSTWGYGDPSQPTVNAEFSAAKHVRGILSAARDQNINSANSQFFICVATAASLNNQYSIYGRVVSGMNYVDTIVNAPRNLSTDCPLQKIEMFITYIGSNDTVPDPPALTTPTNGAVEVDTLNQLILHWNKAIDGIIYHFEMSTDSTFTTIDKSYNTGSLFYVTPGLLPSNTKYYWRVKTNNGGHFSAFSPVWHFKTMDPTVGIKTNYVENRKLLVYPNPGTGKFTFTDVEKGSVAEVFDSSGRQVLSSAIKENNPVIDLEGKEKGIYTYRITGRNNSVFTGKLIIK